MAELNREFLVNKFGSEDRLKEQTEIEVKYNDKIKRINSNAFNGLVNLETLSLSDNEIEVIEANSFESLVNLKVLKLNSNKIKQIDSNTFKGLSNLEELELNSNQISKIEPNAFECLGNLRLLWLNKNNMKVIESNVFNGLLRLENLYLLFNDIEVIETNAFEGLSNLIALLMRCKIKHVKSHAFKGLTGIRKLCLNSLEISEIEEHAFNGLSNLTEVNLSNNKLKKINAYTFEGLESLMMLSLNMNEIEEIEENAFHGLSKLIVLFLNGNKLKKINRKAFEPLKSIKVLRLYDNDIDFFSYANRNVSFDEELNKREFYTDWDEFIEDIAKKNYKFDSQRMLIVDYYDSLINDIDIYTDAIEKYNENHVIPNEPKVDKNYSFTNEINLKEVENHKFFEIDSIIDPYKEEYKYNNDPINVKSTKLHDYVNQIRSKSIEEIKKVKEENLQHYEINRDKFKCNRNDLTPAKVEEMRRELFKEKFCFLLRIDNIFDVKIPIKYITIITDFYLDHLDLFKLRKTLKNCFPYNLKLTQNAFLTYLLAKYVRNRLYYEIYGNEVIFITRDDLFKIERLNGLEANIFFVENNKHGNFELNSSIDYSNIKSLGITKGDYSKLDDLGNSMTNLEYLYISNMNIRDATFNSFNKLIKLSLKHCAMNRDSKWSLKNLRILEIREFTIGAYSIDLEGLESLKILILESIESFDCLKNLGRKLTGLSISSSVIFEDKKPINSFIRRHDFSNVTHLRLHLSPKNVDFSIWFKSFNSLKKLSLIGSCRNSLNLEFLKTESLNQLEYLNLSDNSILTIRKEDFSQLKSLKHLDISKNQISNIEPDVFAETTPLLAHLDLRDNKCKIEENTFYSLLKHLKTIQF